MLKEQFVRTKPHLNIGIIGHSQHGKTTLASAISKYCASQGLAQAKEYSTLNANTVSTIEFDSPNGHYALVDCSGKAEHILDFTVAMNRLDLAILVVDPMDSVMAQTREHILLARQSNIQAIVIFINKCDLFNDEEILELIGLEIQAHLGYNQYPEATPIIQGSALEASLHNEQWVYKIEELLGVIDDYITMPERDGYSDFYMPIDGFTESSEGVWVSGKIKEGSINTGDEVEVVGYNTNLTTTIKEINIFNKILNTGKAGDFISILLQGVSGLQVGQVLCLPRSVTSSKTFNADVYCPLQNEGGAEQAISNGSKVTICLDAAVVSGTLSLSSTISPGDNGNVSIVLDSPIGMKRDDKFVIRTNDGTIGSGVVTELIA